MPYTIEFLANSEELHQHLAKAASILNSVQNEFNFRGLPPQQKSSAYFFKQKEYDSVALLEWLQKFKDGAPGNHQFMILVVDGSFQKNLFGNAIVASGVATFTTHSHASYTKDLIRYCKYFLVRYALGFFANEVRNHDGVKECMFFNKKYKPDISNSLENPEICDICRPQMQSRFGFGNYEAITKLLLAINDKLPRALIMKGGGIKGLAYAGAISELEKYFVFDTFVGTSAGAIAAVLLGAGYTSLELLQILKSKNFKEFKDSGLLQGIKNWILYKGYHSGDEFTKWVDGLIKVKFPGHESEIRMKDLKYRTAIYASRALEGTITFDSDHDNKDRHASFAARCSMSIPGFFTPLDLDGQRVYDGGLRNNFPLKFFHDANKEKPFIGLYLISKTPKRNSFFSKEVRDIVTEGEERGIVDAHRDCVVSIDPATIKTTAFNLTVNQKSFLTLSGQLAALKFLKEFYPYSKVDPQLILRTTSELETVRSKI